MNPLTGSRRELDSVVVNIELTLASNHPGCCTVFPDRQRARYFVVATLGRVSLCGRRFVRDFYLLVVIDHSHANPDQMATGICAQLFLHRLRARRGDFV